MRRYSARRDDTDGRLGRCDGAIDRQGRVDGAMVDIVTSPLPKGENEVARFDNVGLRYGTDREVLSDLSFTLFPGRLYFLTRAGGGGQTARL
ncbi:MAG: hypothetical protein VX454_13180 [Pseudomonadota bacterium]|nr:hypothetical protein [Pseudomonadota bacterium]